MKYDWWEWWPLLLGLLAGGAIDPNSREWWIYVFDDNDEKRYNDINYEIHDWFMNLITCVQNQTETEKSARQKKV